MGKFIGGLEEQVKLEVRAFGPRSLEGAMELAGRISEKWERLKTGPSWTTNPNKFHNPWQYPKNPIKISQNPLTSPYPKTASSNNTRTAGTPHQTWTHSRNSGEFRRLSEKELQEKRVKGLCFKCDGKWGIGHVCSKKEMSVLLVGEAEVEEMAGMEDEGVEELEEVSDPGKLQTQISMNSLVGITSPKTMKLRGMVAGQGVVVMVDPGATHNFIALELVEKLGVHVTPARAFEVSLGNGEVVQGEGECKEVTVELGEVTIVENFFPLTLGNSDLILGIQWLEKLGEIVTNWKLQTMKFRSGGRVVRLQGDPTLGKTQISLKAMIRTITKEGGGFLVELNQVENGVDRKGEEAAWADVPEGFQELLEAYAGVFQKPAGLPPSRGREHAIILKEGTNPIHVRPYRYP